MKEITTMRSKHSKTYSSGNKKILETYTIPIHYLSEIGKGKDITKETWEEIDNKLYYKTASLSVEYDNLWYVSGGQHTIGFRSDGDMEKHRGIRLYEDDNHQYETTINNITFNDKSLKLSKTYNTISKTKDNVMNHIISTTPYNVKLVTQVLNHCVKDYIETNTPLTNFEIKEIIDLTGYEVINNYTSSGNNRYYKPSGNKDRFIFQSITEPDKRIWKKQPRMWSIESSSDGISHTLQLIKDVLYYTKTSTPVGEDWLLEQGGLISIDSTDYYVESDADDGYIKSQADVHVDQPTTWIDTRAGDNYTVSTGDTSAANVKIYSALGKSGYLTYIIRSYFRFDITSLSAGSTITDVDLSLYANSIGGSIEWAIMEGTQGVEITNADWHATGATLATSATIVASQYNPTDLGNDGNQFVQDNIGGYVHLSTWDNDNDYPNTAPVGNTNTFTIIDFNEGTNVPKLTITFTPPPGDEGPIDCDNPGEIATNSTNYGNELYNQTVAYGNELREYSTCADMFEELMMGRW